MKQRRDLLDAMKKMVDEGLDDDGYNAVFTCPGCGQWIGNDGCPDCTEASKDEKK